MISKCWYTDESIIIVTTGRSEATTSVLKWKFHEMRNCLTINKLYFKFGLTLCIHRHCSKCQHLNKGTFLQDFLVISKLLLQNYQKNIGEMFPCHYMHSDFISKFKIFRPHNSVHYERVKNIGIPREYLNANIFKGYLKNKK